MHKWHFTPIPQEELERLRRDCDIPDMPTQMTYHLRSAISDRGDYRDEWKDKPHRLIYDACREIERLTVISNQLAEEGANPMDNCKRLCTELLHAIESYLCFTDAESTTAGQRADRLNKAMAAASTALESTTQPANVVRLLPGETIVEGLVRYGLIKPQDAGAEGETITIPRGIHIIGSDRLRQTKIVEQ